MVKIRFLFLVALLFWVPLLSAQHVVIAKEPPEKHDTQYGMNRKHYSHGFLGIQFIVGPPENNSAEIYYGRSRSMEYGYRYKRRFNDTFSIGSEINARRHAFHIKQTGKKEVPDNIKKDSEKLVFLDAGLGFYKRMNFGQRGNYIGRFLDLGAYASWVFHTRHVFFLEEDGLNTRVRVTGMNYPAGFAWGLNARIGFNNLVIKGSYQLSDHFKDNSGLPELPKYSVGLEIGLHPF